MTKFFGCTTILAAALLLLDRDRRERCTLLLTVRELRRAIENMATAIRWQQLPLPQAIMAQSVGRYTGELFRKIAEEMQSEDTLQIAWEKTFDTLEEPLRTMLCTICLQGDETQILRQLEGAAQGLATYERTLSTTEQGRRKIFCASTLAGAAVLMILLL